MHFGEGGGGFAGGEDEGADGIEGEGGAGEGYGGGDVGRKQGEELERHCLRNWDGVVDDGVKVSNMGVLERWTCGCMVCMWISVHKICTRT